MSFYDGDEHHPKANIDKMTAGRPLSDADRAAWLDLLHSLLAEQLGAGRSLIVACSALKQSYRRLLTGDLENIHFVYLEGDYKTFHARLASRNAHYMKADMLKSQFLALEEPADAIVVDAALSTDEIVYAVLNSLSS